MITCITSKAKNIFITFLIIFLLLAGCKTSSQQQTPDIPTLVYANLSKNSNIRSLVNKFNTAHAGEVRIEVRNYFEDDSDIVEPSQEELAGQAFSGLVQLFAFYRQ